MTGIWFGILRGISAIAVISNVSTICIFCVLHWERTGHLIPFYTTKAWQEFQILNDTMIDCLHWAPDEKCLYAYLIYSLYNLISTAVLQYFIKFHVILIIFNQINLAFVRFNQNKSNINLLKISFAFIFCWQAAIIAFTSEFIPKLVYLYGYSPDQTLSGYTNFSLSEFKVQYFAPQSVPDDPKMEIFGNVTQCRFVSLFLQCSLN